MLSFCIQSLWPNQPAAGKAEVARLLAIEPRCPGLPEPERWAVGPVIEAAAIYNGFPSFV